MVTVELPEDLVGALDSLISEGAAPNRDVLIERAVRRELRRRLYDREAEQLLRAHEHGVADEMTDMVSWAAANFRVAD